MLWTGLFFAGLSGLLAGLKYVGIPALAAWGWWWMAAPGLFFVGFLGLWVVGTAVHFLTRRVMGFDDSKGVD